MSVEGQGLGIPLTASHLGSPVPGAVTHLQRPARAKTTATGATGNLTPGTWTQGTESTLGKGGRACTVKRKTNSERKMKI